jgi:ABC-type polar amino acid transport system ATPase subunit
MTLAILTGLCTGGCNRIVLIGEGSAIAEAATEQFLRNPSHPRIELFLSKIL